VQFVALGHLHRLVQPLFHAICKRLSGVAAVNQHAFYGQQIKFVRANDQEVCRS